ncbi:MAG: FKBP-type peptidyl-prolyl cis-trans isomerase [Bacteroidales bacterium]|nr:FKBP-type peptidyl-prolyl cis-trans isomerase [Bacteroidales bacterium]
MKIKSIIRYFPLFIVFCLIYSCESKYPGYKKTKSGLYYKIHESHPDSVLAKPGDVLTIKMKYGTKDTVLYNTNELPEPRIFTLRESDYEGDLYEGFTMLRNGDSASFIVGIDSFFLVTIHAPHIPDYIKDNKEMYFDIKMLNIKSKEIVEQEKQEFLRQLKANEDTIFEQYLKENNITEKPRESGLYYFEKEKGKGPLIVKDDVLFIHFTQWRLDGTKVFSTYDKEKPIELTVGMWHNSDAMDEAFSLLRENGKAWFLAKSDLLFGEGGNGDKIPPYTSLFYEVEIIDKMSIKEYRDFKERLRRKKAAAREKAKQEEPAKFAKFIKENNITVEPTKSGMYFIEIKEGDGIAPQAGDKVLVEYIGTLLDGTEFESSLKRGKPYSFVVGSGKVIDGWEEAILKMREGGKARIIIPSSLAYGAATKGKIITPYSPLIFELELLKVK